MTSDHIYWAVLTALTLVLGFLVYQILKPFMAPVVWAVVLSILFYPLYTYAVKRLHRESLCALLVLAVILFVILGPFSYLAVSLIKELTALQADAVAGRLEVLRDLLHNPTIRSSIERVTSLAGISPEDLNTVIGDSITQMGKDLVGGVTKGVREILSVMLNFVIMSLAIFFFLKHGPAIVGKIHSYAPFSKKQRDLLATQVKDMIASTLYGGVAVGLVQGFLGGIAFSLVGVSSPVLWGAVMAISSFLPIVGPFIVWVPAAVFLFMDGAIARGIALVFMGLAVSSVDNVLRPLIVRNRTKMPFLAVFISVLGGIKYFGLIGFVLGPLVLAIFVSVADIFMYGEGRLKETK